MLKLVEYGDSFRTSWNDFARENGTLFHTIEWKEVLEEVFGYKSIYCMAMDDNGRIAALLPVLAGRNLFLKKAAVSLPFANHLDICCRDREALGSVAGALRELQEKKGLDYIEIRLKDQILEAGDSSVNGNNYTFLLPLEGGEERVLALSTGNNRNHTRKVYKNGYFSVSFDFGHMDAFYEVWRRRQKQLGSPDHGPGLFKAIKERFPEHAVLLTATDNGSGRVVGGMFLLAWGNTLFYPWGGALTEYNNRYVNNFMYWEAAKFGMRNGLEYLDLGRSPAGSGTYRFKEQWGAKPVRLTYCRIGKKAGRRAGADRDAMGPAVSLWKAMPACITNFAGPRLIKYVMP